MKLVYQVKIKNIFEWIDDEETIVEGKIRVILQVKNFSKLISREYFTFKDLSKTIYAET